MSAPDCKALVRNLLFGLKNQKKIWMKCCSILTIYLFIYLFIISSCSGEWHDNVAGNFLNGLREVKNRQPGRNLNSGPPNT
jgi:hypothetical protein